MTREEIIAKRISLKAQLDEIDAQLDKEFIRVEKAGHYLCFNSHDEGREMIKKLEEAAENQEGHQLCSDVDAVLVWEELENTLTIDEFFSLID